MPWLYSYENFTLTRFFLVETVVDLDVELNRCSHASTLIQTSCCKYLPGAFGSGKFFNMFCPTDR